MKDKLVCRCTNNALCRVHRTKRELHLAAFLFNDLGASEIAAALSVVIDEIEKAVDRQIELEVKAGILE